MPLSTELKIGQRYRVSLNDCCIVGGFTATLVDMDRPADPDHLTFDNGVILTTFNGVTFEEV